MIYYLFMIFCFFRVILQDNSGWCLRSYAANSSLKKQSQFLPAPGIAGD
jgi:hypothetical protein